MLEKSWKTDVKITLKMTKHETIGSFWTRLTNMRISKIIDFHWFYSVFRRWAGPKTNNNDWKRVRKYDQTGDQKTIGKVSKHEAKLGLKSVNIFPKGIQNINLETLADKFSEK